MKPEPMTVKDLRESLAGLPDNLPVVLTSDAWQWVLTQDCAPKLAQWSGKSVGTPQTAEKLAQEVEYMGEDYAARFCFPCVAIGYID